MQNSAGKKSTRELVWEACDSLWSHGVKPGMTGVRQIVGPNPSATTVQSAMNDWWAALAKRTADFERVPALPDDVAGAARQFWTVAVNNAAASFESERTAFAQREEQYQTEITELRAALDDVRLKFELLSAEFLAKVEETNVLSDNLSSVIAQKSAAEELLLKANEDIQALHHKNDQLHREHAEVINSIWLEAEAKIKESQDGFKADIDLAHLRFADSERRMLVEIDRARDETKTTEKRLSGEISRLETDLTIAQASYAKQMTELRHSRDQAVSRADKFESKNEQLSEENERLMYLVHQLMTGLNRKTERLVKLHSQINARFLKNTPIVEANMDEIETLLSEGGTPCSIAAGLSDRYGFDGGGAALNLVLKKMGVL